MQNHRPAADSFQRIVANLVTNFHFERVGYESTFLAGSAPVNVWIPAQMTFVLHLMAGDLGLETGVETYLDTVSIVLNKDDEEPENWDVVNGDGRSVGSFKTIESAMGHALHAVCQRNWFAGAQNEDGLVAV